MELKVPVNHVDDMPAMAPVNLDDPADLMAFHTGVIVEERLEAERAARVRQWDALKPWKEVKDALVSRATRAVQYAGCKPRAYAAARMGFTNLAGIPAVPCEEEVAGLDASVTSRLTPALRFMLESGWEPVSKGVEEVLAKPAVVTTAAFRSWWFMTEPKPAGRSYYDSDDDDW